jgi:hypothetical protein
MRAGDTVKHGPSGETWVLAWAERGKVSACGWPASIADESDCTLAEASTDEQHRDMLEKWANPKYRGDYRHSVCCDQLATLKGE